MDYKNILYIGLGAAGIIVAIKTFNFLGGYTTRTITENLQRMELRPPPQNFGEEIQHVIEDAKGYLKLGPKILWTLGEVTLFSASAISCVNGLEGIIKALTK